MRKLLFISFLALFACTEQNAEKEISLPFYLDAQLSPVWIEDDSSAFRTIHQIDDFEFTDQKGESFGSKNLENKVYIANFFFTTCPGICKLMTKELHAVQDSFAANHAIDIVSFSVMPWIDTVEQLQYFQEMNDIDGGVWHFLTGEKAVIYNVARQSFFADEGFGKSVTGSSDFLHTENVMLIDKQKRIRGVYSGTSRLDISRMIEDVKQLLSEPS
ncbi:MAG: SCO family protein [Salibacteraceae bacterium]|nr:SCO family protein [Salibacteraceae bacterium]